MLFHYALVDDLISKEEFERRVEAKIDDCGDLVDEPTAAMMVVGRTRPGARQDQGALGQIQPLLFFRESC